MTCRATRLDDFPPMQTVVRCQHQSNTWTCEESSVEQASRATEVTVSRGGNAALRDGRARTGAACFGRAVRTCRYHRADFGANTPRVCRRKATRNQKRSGLVWIVVEPRFDHVSRIAGHELDQNSIN